MGICPNCGSWVDEGDICMGCGYSGSYSFDYDNEESSEYVNPRNYKGDKYSNKAWEYYLDFKDEDALYYIDLALDLDNRHSENWNRKAIILKSLKRYRESEECYNKSLELSKSTVVYDNKAKMLLAWSYQLLEESKKLPNGLNKLKEAENKIMDAIIALSGDTEEDINKYLDMRDRIKYYIDYETRFQKNLETLKGHDKSELFTITGRNFYKNNIIPTPGMPLKLVKEPDNEFDKDAIAVYAHNEKIGYVANNDYTKYELTSSASELQDKIEDTAQGSYLFYLGRYADIQFNIGKIIN